MTVQEKAQAVRSAIVKETNPGDNSTYYVIDGTNPKKETFAEFIKDVHPDPTPWPNADTFEVIIHILDAIAESSEEEITELVLGVDGDEWGSFQRLINEVGPFGDSYPSLWDSELLKWVGQFDRSAYVDDQIKGLINRSIELSDYPSFYQILMNAQTDWTQETATMIMRGLLSLNHELDYLKRS